MTIHWCGTGLSAIPGLRRLIGNGHPVVVWNRSVSKAEEVIGDVATDIREFQFEALTEATRTGDVVVSMLPGDWHVPIAEMCIGKSANFVSSSYIAPEMKALDTAAKNAGVCAVNEVGLDPGIDHLMAHKLIADYASSDVFNTDNDISFVSYCGGIPKIPNEFRYKFSWSPLGVLKALRSPSKSIKDFKEFNVSRPWDAISDYQAPLATPETFEVYPNRDSLPFMQDYQFKSSWRVKEFVRGTLRLNGWKDAWADVFTEIEALEGAAGDRRLQEMSDGFWAANSYDDGEPDRVVLFVELKAEAKGQTVFHRTYALDAYGDERGTAMARLVSVPVSLAIEAVVQGRIEHGVHPAPHTPDLVNEWLAEVGKLSQYLEVIEHV